MQSIAQGPMTYLHGDLHVANTYLTAEGTVGVCDWQCGLQGSWVHDYAYIVATAPDIEDRRAWERELLRLYLNTWPRRAGRLRRRRRGWPTAGPCSIRTSPGCTRSDAPGSSRRFSLRT